MGSKDDGTSQSSSFTDDSSSSDTIEELFEPSPPEERKSGKEESFQNGMKNFLNNILDPMEIKQNEYLQRPSINKRLQKFQKDQKQRKLKPITDQRRREKASTVRAKQTTNEVLKRLEWYLITKMAENRLSIFEAEKVKHERKFIESMKKIDLEEEAIRNQIKKNVEKEIEKEMKHLNDMKREYFEHEISSVVRSTELELKNKYKNYLMKLNLLNTRDDYNNEMDDYCAEWKEAATKLCQEVHEQNKLMKKRKYISLDQKLLESMVQLEAKWIDKAEDSIKDSSNLVERVFRSIPQKEKELKKIVEENDKLEKSIGQYEKIVPTLLNEMEKFVAFTFTKVEPERENLMKTINKLKAFKDVRPEEVTAPRKLLKSEICRENITTEKEYYGWNVARSLSVEENFLKNRKKLQKIKVCLLDTLSRVEDNTGRKENEGQLKIDSKIVIKNMSDIINIIDSMFEIVGVRHSAPNIEDPEQFIKKRRVSTEKIEKKTKLNTKG